MKLRLILAWLALVTLPCCIHAQTKVIPVQGGTGCTAGPGKIGQIPISDGTKLCPGDPFITANTPAIVHKAGASIGGATVKTLTDTITATTAGNSLILAICAGEVANGSTIILTITETGGSDTWTLAATQAISTTFGCSFYYATNITAGVTAAIATYSGASSANTTIAMYTWEVSGLITLSPQVLDTTAIGTATSTTLLAGQVQAAAPNDYAFAAFGVGTAAQTVTLTGSGTWTNDSGQVNPASASGLFSFVGASQWIPSESIVSAGGTITSEPWVAVLALFRPVALPDAQIGTYAPNSVSNFATPVCTAAMISTTSTITAAAPPAGQHFYATSIGAYNSHASVDTFVIFQDGSGGTTLWEGFALHAGGGFNLPFPVPIRLPTVGNAMYVADVTTGANVIACVAGFYGP